MNIISYRDFPIITICLIVLNVLVFFIFQNIITTPTVRIDTETCLLKNAPECASRKLATMKEMTECMTANEYKSADECSYKTEIKISCAITTAPSCFPSNYRTFYKFGFVPYLVAQGKQLSSFITSLFMHANFQHLSINMLYLFLFGVPVELNMGKKRFVLFYFLVGIISSLASLIIHPTEVIPEIGASGAIFGLAGAFFVIYSSKKIICDLGEIPIFKKLRIFSRSDSRYIYFSVFYFILIMSLQLFYYLLNIEPGVGYVNHIGGFLGGALLSLFLGRRIIFKDYLRSQY